MDRWYLQINRWARGTLWVFTCLSGTLRHLGFRPTRSCSVFQFHFGADLLPAIYIFPIRIAVREEVAGRAPTVYFQWQRLSLWPLASTLNSCIFLRPFIVNEPVQVKRGEKT